MPRAVRWILSRASSPKDLTAKLGQSVIVDDKPGGNGVIGIRETLKAAPDGYTFQLGSVGANVTPALMQTNYPFDPLKDYVPVAMVAEWSAILVVKKDLPVNTLAEFVAYAKARPGQLNFGATGYGGLAHLVSEVFMQKTGITMQHVQYKGGSQSTTDLLAGTLDATFMSSRGRRRSGQQSAAEDAGGREQATAWHRAQSADDGRGRRGRRRPDLMAGPVLCARRTGADPAEGRASDVRGGERSRLSATAPRHRP